MKQLICAIFIFIIINYQTEFAVTERVRGVVIGGGYALTERDEVFALKGKKYHIRIKELFKYGELEEVKIWKPEGYLTYSKKELSEDLSLLELYDLDAKVVIEFSEKDKLSVNAEVVQTHSVDKSNNLIFYEIDGNDRTMYRLNYE